MLFQVFKLRKFFITILTSLLLFGIFYYLSIGIEAQTLNTEEEIKLFPGFYTDGIGWQNPQAVFIRDLDQQAEFKEFNQENSAYLLFTDPELNLPAFTTSTTSVLPAFTTSTTSVLEFFDFSVIDQLSETKIKNVQLRLSLAGKSQTSDQLTIEYQQAGLWQNLDTLILETEISNATNSGYWLYALPVIELWSDFKEFKIRFIYTGTEGEIYLEALWLEVNYEKEISVPASLGSSFIATKEEPAQIKGKKHFKASENPSFDLFEADTNPESIKIKKYYLIDSEGRKMIIEMTRQGNKITIERPRKFKPGKYLIQLEVEKDGQLYMLEQEFRWGVLAINTNKSIYLPDEQAYLQMGALRDDGHTICDADLKLEIISPNGIVDYPKVEISGLCSGNNVVEVPDYFAYYAVTGIGEYQMKLINLDNDYEIIDFFEVWESVPFDIERIGPTRIYPLADYQITFKIKVNQDFIGQVRESVPPGFEISADQKAQIITNIKVRKIIWSVDWQAGETHELRYSFDAPDISPYLYLLGPLELHDEK
ncbi:hypothetical protein IID20_03680 [Patescibacteria group bacterium]|nr:hypothetical protein [Patescibacteria group bacterium]